MNYPLHEIQALTELLSHEATGKPFDRDLAHRLASQLGEIQPEIRLTMQLVCQRLKAGDVRH